jgi:hypothetical protein
MTSQREDLGSDGAKVASGEPVSPTLRQAIPREAVGAFVPDRAVRNAGLREEPKLGWSDLGDAQVLIGRASVFVDDWSNRACRTGCPGAAVVLLDDASAALHRALIAIKEFDALYLLNSQDILIQFNMTAQDTP